MSNKALELIAENIRLKKEIENQKAEIERLKESEDIRPTGCPNCHKGNFSNSKFCSHCGTQLQGKKKDVRAEARKEFAEKLHEAIDSFREKREMVMLPYTEAALLYVEKNIDNLLEEMESEK